MSHPPILILSSYSLNLYILIKYNLLSHLIYHILPSFQAYYINYTNHSLD